MVGHKFDAQLDDCCYGARLKRIHNNEFLDEETECKPFHISRRSAVPDHLRIDSEPRIRGQDAQVVAAYKRPSEADSANWVCSEYFESGWMPATAERVPLPLALDLAGLYEQLLHRIVPIAPRTQEKLRDLIARTETVMTKAKEVAKAEARLAKEKRIQSQGGDQCHAASTQNRT